MVNMKVRLWVKMRERMRVRLRLNMGETETEHESEKADDKTVSQMADEAMGPDISKPNTQKGDTRILMTSYIASNLKHAKPVRRVSSQQQ